MVLSIFFSFTSRAKAVSKMIKDQPSSPKENIVFWTEYVIRHNGAENLNSVMSSIPLYQYLLLDIISFIFLAIIAVIASLYLSFKIVFSLLRKISIRNEKDEKND